ncbi:glycosyltransferase family 2 protein [Patescibacteria group bacterium]|nr:glycosyltransferase family 2 protein [Patescibacteria group bacterium]
MVSIILVTFNSEKYILETITRVFKQTYKNIELIIIDNNSTDNTIKILKKLPYKFRLIENDKNVGFAKANNMGLRIAKGKYILTLNHDVYLALNYIKNIIYIMDRNLKIGSAQGIYFSNLQKTKIDSCGIYLNFGYSAKNIKKIPPFNKEIFGTCAAATIYRKALLSKIGFFDIKFISYYEDVDLSIRINRAGFKNYFIRNAECVHLRGISNSTENLTLSFINKYKLLRKHKFGYRIYIAKIYDLLKFPIYYMKNKEFAFKYISLLIKS